MFKNVKYAVLAVSASLAAASAEAGLGDLLKVVTEPSANTTQEAAKPNPNACPQCGGNGFVSVGFKAKKCKVCGGTGIVLQNNVTTAPASTGTVSAPAVVADDDTVVFDDISMDALKRQMGEHKGCLLLDVREPGEFSSGHIKGAVNVPVGRIATRIGTVCGDKSRHIYVYCQSGRRSKVAAQTLAGMGYRKVHNVLGGVNAWNGKLVD